MTLIIICLVAFLASGLTFFSGFGLGTLLLPAFALFFPVEHAVALTGVVHFLNGTGQKPTLAPPCLSPRWKPLRRRHRV